MSVKKPDPDPVLEPEQTSAEKLVDWRRNEFLDMGFTLDQSMTLSVSKDTTTGRHVDKHKVLKVLSKGCSKELAIRIFS